MKVIDNFKQAEYSFLMNSYNTPIEYGGLVYPTVEHAYQAAKTLDLIERNKIKSTLAAHQAKRIGKELVLRPGWDAMREDIMFDLLNKKFNMSTLEKSKLCQKLLLTRDTKLISGGDPFWGMVNGHGENKLGELLMKKRFELSDNLTKLLNKTKQDYLQYTGWIRSPDGDDILNECWAPSWDKDCYFDLDSAVLYQSKINKQIIEKHTK